MAGNGVVAAAGVHVDDPEGRTCSDAVPSPVSATSRTNESGNNPEVNTNPSVVPNPLRYPSACGKNRKYNVDPCLTGSQTNMSMTYRIVSDEDSPPGPYATGINAPAAQSETVVTGVAILPSDMSTGVLEQCQRILTAGHTSDTFTETVSIVKCSLYRPGQGKRALTAGQR